MQLDDIKQFRQWDSKTPGHPENFLTPGVEVTTGECGFPCQARCIDMANAALFITERSLVKLAGPLGQGVCNAVGLAVAEAHLAARFNKPDAKVIDHYT